MPKYRLNNGPLIWPDTCAECGAPATTRAFSTCSVVTKVGFFVLFVRTTHLTATVDYPVCNRHVQTSRIAGAVSARNLFNLFMGVLWIYAVIGTLGALYRLAFRQEWESLVSLAWFGSAFAIGLAIMWLARRYTPVKLNGADEKTRTCTIRREDYAAEFLHLNKQRLIAEIPWWKS